MIPGLKNDGKIYSVLFYSIMIGWKVLSSQSKTSKVSMCDDFGSLFFFKMLKTDLFVVVVQLTTFKHILDGGKQYGSERT